MSSEEGRVKIPAVTKAAIHSSKMIKNKTLQIQRLPEQKLFCGVSPRDRTNAPRVI